MGDSVSDVALRMEHVYKKFRKGEVYNSLRDLLPAVTGKMFQGRELNADDEREFWALQDVSFEVKRGEALGIIGHNGAGKSTALKILSRIMKPTKGRMIVNGRLSALLEVTAGFHPDLTGMENIFLHGTILGMRKREIQSKLDQIIAFSGLEEFINTPVKRYSSGMYARLGFSVAAHVDPEVLIVDEVLSVGDYVFQQRCLDRIRSIINSGTTVLFVSHNLKAVTEVCKRAMLLEHGKIVINDQTDAVIRRYQGGKQREEIPEEDKAAYVSSVRMRDRAGEQSTFESGDTAWVDVEITARQAVDRLAVVIWLLDEKRYEIFNTSTERLGCTPVALQPGQSYRCTFELTLNLAHGTFGLCAAVHRYDIGKSYDQKKGAVTLFIGSSLAVRGAVNCFPRVVEDRVLEVGAENGAVR
jgi:ABC-type polysaccharide/polyol phosphate transport system ATPase subunit